METRDRVRAFRARNKPKSFKPQVCSTVLPGTQLPLSDYLCCGLFSPEFIMLSWILLCALSWWLLAIEKLQA